MSERRTPREVSVKRPKKPLLTRRGLLVGVVGGVLAGPVADRLGVYETIGSFIKKAANKTSSVNQNETLQQAVAVAQSIEQKPTIESMQTANTILSLPLFSKERDVAETEFGGRSKNKIEDIDFALSVTHNGEENRLALLNRRFELNQQGHGELTPLSKELQDWASEWGIGPNNMTMSMEAYPYALAVIKQLMPLIRADFPPDTDPRTLTLTPGGMAALFHRESRGLVGIGTEQALSQINDAKDAFPTDKDDLRLVCQILSEDFGLNYVPENIPGSEWVKPDNKSGGAIGPQFMPNRAKEFLSLNKAYNLLLNPFDPIDSYVLAHELIARHEGDIPRYGFVQGDSIQTMYALEKWNAFPDEMLFIFDADEDYKRRFAPDLPATPDIRALFAKHDQKQKTA